MNHSTSSSIPNPFLLTPVHTCTNIYMGRARVPLGERESQWLIPGQEGLGGMPPSSMGKSSDINDRTFRLRCHSAQGIEWSDSNVVIALICRGGGGPVAGSAVPRPDKEHHPIQPGGRSPS